MGHVVRTKRYDLYVTITHEDDGVWMEFSSGVHVVLVITGTNARKVIRRGFNEMRIIDLGGQRLSHLCRWIEA